MRRLKALLVTVALVLTLSACNYGPEASDTTGQTEEQEQTVQSQQVIVDIMVNEDGRYSLMSDAEVHYSEDGQAEWITISDPVLLAFCVSSERGGVYLIDLDDGEKVMTELLEIADALETAGKTEYVERIYAVLDIIANAGPYTQAST